MLKALFGTAGQDPIVLDLDGDGVETLSQDTGVFFDHDANGFAQLFGWVASDDGLLVWNRNGNGQIDDGSELFGNNSLLENGQKAASGSLPWFGMGGSAIACLGGALCCGDRCNRPFWSKLFSPGTVWLICQWFCG